MKRRALIPFLCLSIGLKSWELCYDRSGSRCASIFQIIPSMEVWGYSSSPDTRESTYLIVVFSKSCALLAKTRVVSTAGKCQTSAARGKRRKAKCLAHHANFHVYFKSENHSPAIMKLDLGVPLLSTTFYNELKNEVVQWHHLPKFHLSI